VYPLNFQIQFLIVIYAALILGGSGSLAGAVAGGIVVTLMLDLLRDPAQASAAFYGVIAVTLIAKVRPWRTLAAVVGATVALGYVVHFLVGGLWPDAVAGDVEATGAFGSAIKSWVVLPEDPTTIGNWAFCALVVGVVALTRVSARTRTILLIPLLYLSAFVWEARLVDEPSITRQLLLGALLIVMMISRPHGLLGTPRVERV
jgi:ABC-type branched-subunit amino acid transport system permease subunit